MSPAGISLREWIIIHITYRDVFNAPVSLEDLQKWIGKERIQVKTELDLLKATGILETDGRDCYCLKGRSKIFSHQLAKQRLSQRSLNLHAPVLTWLKFFPFVRFIGISGSVAANNATIERVGHRKKKVDLDIFVITAPRSLWLVCLFERVMTNLLTPLLREKYTLCFNYSMDESFLEIHNKGIYTATELYNLKPIYNFGQTYQKLLRANEWVQSFYPELKCDFLDPRKNFKTTLTSIVSWMVTPLNILAFLFFHFGRALKNGNLKPFREMSFAFDPCIRYSLTRCSQAYGGYEGLIAENFEKRLNDRFHELQQSVLFGFLFPNQKAIRNSQKEFNDLVEAFTKYSLPTSV